MAVFDALKLLRFNKIYKVAWGMVWEQVKTPPAGDSKAAVAHLCFIGTLMYAVRYQVALSAGMSDSFAKSMAVVAVSKAGYDTQMEDDIYAVFSLAAGAPEQQYVSELSSVIGLIVGAAKAGHPCAETEISAHLNQLRAQYDLLLAVSG